MRETDALPLRRRPRRRLRRAAALAALAACLALGASTPLSASSPGYPPTASFTFSPAKPLTGEVVEFRDNSTDPEGALQSWRWDFGDGNTSTARNATHAYADDGAYKVALRVTDAQGLNDTVSQVVTVANRPPTARLGISPAQPTTADTVAFQDQSTDPDGKVVSWQWDFGDGVRSAARHPQHRYPRHGSYTVTLVVVDDDSASATAAAVVQVLNLPPQAGFRWEPSSPREGDEVVLTSTASDPEGNLVNWTWTLGDGGLAHGERVVHRFPAGAWSVTLRVLDDSGASAEARQTLGVAKAPPPAEPPAAEPAPPEPPSAAVGYIQPLVDAAAPGAVVRIPPGRYAENVRIAKDLTLVGEGVVVIDGGAKPALELSGGRIRIEGVDLRSQGSPLVMRDAPAVELWNVTALGGAPAVAERVAWVRIVAPAKEEPPFPSLIGSAAVHAHLVGLRVLREDGAPWAGARVRLLDGKSLAFEGTADARGEVGPVPVAHRFATPASSGVNVTVAVVEGLPGSFPVDPHAGILEIQARAAAKPGLPPAAAVAALAGAGAAAGLALGFRLHEGFRWRWLLALAPLYTRLARSQLLEHGVREAIYGHVEEHPGAHLRGIKRDLALHHGTLLHHLHMLESQGYLRSVRDGMYRRYYVSGSVPVPPGSEGLGEEVARFVAEHPGASNAEVARALGKRPSLVHYHVARLEGAGRVRKERVAGEVRLYPAGTQPSEEAPPGPGG